MIDDLYIGENSYPAQWIIFKIIKFGIIIRMDWLVKHGVHINCKKNEIVNAQGNDIQVTFRVQKTIIDEVSINSLCGTPNLWD